VDISGSTSLHFTSTFTQKDWLNARLAAGRMAEGGRITKGSGPTADDVPILVSKGETVVSASDSADPGFRSWAAAKGIPGFRSGGIPLPGGATKTNRAYTGVGKIMDRWGTLIEAAGIKAAMEAMAAFDGTAGARVSGPIAAIVRSAAAGYGWGSGAQWNALSWIISHESGWRPTAQNPTSSAYGLFQFLNGTWAGVGGRKTSDPYLQSVYGLRYIRNRYRTPLGAQAFWQAHGWYDNGGWLQPGTTVATNRTGRPERVVGPREVLTVHLDPASARMVADHVVRGLHSTPIIIQIDGNQLRTGIKGAQRRAGVPAREQVR
jgi:hypothetical protein